MNQDNYAMKDEEGNVIETPGEMFRRALATRDYSPGDVEAGRGHVRAYVGYIHYVERLHQAIPSQPHPEDVSTHDHDH